METIELVEVVEEEYDDIEFIETSAELLATSYYVNIQ
jgi:hypothetical protein